MYDSALVSNTHTHSLLDIAKTKLLFVNIDKTQEGILAIDGEEIPYEDFRMSVVPGILPVMCPIDKAH